MADHDSERTESPTPRRRSEAVRQGQVPRSMDLSAGVVLLGALLLLRYLGEPMFAQLLAIVRELETVDSVRTEALARWLERAWRAAMDAMLPFLLALTVVAALAGVLQTGPMLVWARLEPKLDQLSPMRGLKRLFSSESLQRLGMGLLKLGLVGAVGYVTVTGQLLPLLSSGNAEPRSILSIGATFVFTLGVRLALVLLVIGLIDYFYQRWRTEESLKMTKQEVKDEMRSMEGDPALKQRRRQLQMQLAMQRLRTDVPKADVVVTNPTHYSVALRYDEQRMSAPRVVAKGKDWMALQIRQIARQHDVPVVERPPLARALYAQADVGQEVPAQLYRAVAELLAYVYRLRRGAATG